MPINGIVWALDIGIRCGFCYGLPGAVPVSGSVILKKSDEDRCVAFGNLIWFLHDRWSKQRPHLFVKERRFSMAASKTRNNSQAANDMAGGLHGIAEGMCNRFGVPWIREDHDVADSTMRKHFIGRGRMGTREDTKAAMLTRCKALKLMPADCDDDNQADAIGAWDWACATFAMRSESSKRLVFLEPQREQTGRKRP